MLHGADKGFVESGKYGKPGKYFLGFLNSSFGTYSFVRLR